MTAVPPIKVIIAERSGTDLDFNEEYDLEADGIPFAPGVSGLVSTEIGPALREAATATAVSASPGFTWGRSGNISQGSYLQNDTVPSNVSGRIVPVSDGFIKTIFISQELPEAITVTVQRRVGGSLVDLVSASTLATERVKIVTVDAAVSLGDELAVYISAGSPKNAVVGLVIKGSS
jgi:hypothetical protein